MALRSVKMRFPHHVEKSSFIASQSTGREKKCSDERRVEVADVIEREDDCALRNRRVEAKADVRGGAEEQPQRLRGKLPENRTPEIHICTTCTETFMLSNASGGPCHLPRERRCLFRIARNADRDMLGARDLVVRRIEAAPSRAGDVDFGPRVRRAVLAFLHLDVAGDEARAESQWRADSIMNTA